MNDEVSVLRHWQIKDFPEEKRKKVTLAAQAAMKTVAAWLEPVIDQALAGPQLNTEVIRSVNRANPSASNASDVDDICRLVASACEFAEHREHMQRDLAAAVSRRLRIALKGQTGLPPRSKPPIEKLETHAEAAE